jgi:phospholipid/cholesterol/gamma-HCH transport system permease protein
VATSEARHPVARALERIGRNAVAAVEELGTGAALVAESAYWLLLGRRFRQPVRLGAVFQQMMEIGIYAVPIVALLAATIGIMLAIQGIFTLRIFGAESRVTVGIALSTVREFAPLITGIVVAGRSGSSLAARLGTMKINQEIDALKVMAINPVRFLVVPPLLALLIMVPTLTFFSDLLGLFAGGLYVSVALDITLAAYADQVLEVLTVDHIMHGLGKSVIFALLIAVIGIVNGASITGGAEGVGRVTTRAVVQSISAIVITDMAFAFVVAR